MKTLIFVLIFISFLQSTALPLNLSLTVILLRSFLHPGKENLYLAFLVGLLISFLGNSPMGLYSLLFVSFCGVAQIVAKSRLANHILFATSLVFISQMIYYLFNFLVFSQSFQIWPTIFIETFFAVPAYFLVKFWEERFIVQREIKLKV